MTSQMRNPMTGTLDTVGMRVVPFSGIPKLTDFAYNLGTFGRNEATGDFYILRGNDTNAAEWQNIASSALDFYEDVLSIADASLAPPTEVVGARYILDTSTPVHAEWDGAVAQDIVDFNGSTWIATTPSSGGFVYVTDATTLYVFTSGTWKDITSAIPDATTTQKGVGETSTNVEAQSATAIDKFLVPGNLPSIFSQPPALGDVTPNTAAATQLLLSSVTAPAHDAGQLFYDSATDALTFHNSESGVALQIGEENWIKVRNETGSAITNGTIVYLNGTGSDMPLIEKALADSEDTSKIIGVVTHNIGNEANGYITTFGLVRDLNTNVFSGGEEIFLSTTVAGGVTTTKPDSKTNHIVRIGTIGTADTSNGTFHVNINSSDCIEEAHGYTFNPNGFDDPENEVEVSFVNATNTFTIEPKVSTFVYWSEGIVYKKTASEDIVMDTTEGMHYIYYNGETLSQTITWTNALIEYYALVAIIYWDAANSKQLYLGDEFLHSTKMGSKTHQYLHDTVGFALEIGGGITDIIADGDGDLLTSAQFGNEATEAYDEDARFIFTSRASTSNIAVYYKTNTEADPYWRAEETAAYGVLNTGTGRAAYNLLSGGNWTQAEVTNNDFLLAHIFTINDSTRKFGVIQGEAVYGNANAARDGANTEIASIVLDGLPSAELKFLGTVIYQTSDGYDEATNPSKSRIISTDTGDDYIDLRDYGITRGGVSGTLTDHGALTGLGDDDHPKYLLADGTRALAGAWDMGSQELTNVNIDSGAIDISTGTLVTSAAQKLANRDYAQTVVVAKSGGDYATITAALASITDAATDKRYCIQVMPGTYDETITGKDYVSIVGTDRESCRIAPSSGEALIFTGVDYATYQNLSFISADAATIKQVTTGSTEVTFDKCYFEGYSGQTDTISISGSSNTDFLVNNCVINGGGSSSGIRVVSSVVELVRTEIKDCIFYDSTTCIAPQMRGATAIAAILNIRDCYLNANTRGISLSCGDVSYCVVNSYDNMLVSGDYRFAAADTSSCILNAYGGSSSSITKAGGGGTETFNSYGSVVGGVFTTNVSGIDLENSGLKNVYQQTVVVAKSGGDYTTITAALASITDAATDKRYCIQVMPGTYDEAITMKAYVDVVGINKNTVLIRQDNATIVTMAANSGLYNITVDLANPDAARNVIKYPATTATNIIIEDVNCQQVNAYDSVFIQVVAAAYTNVLVNNCRLISATSNQGSFIKGTATFTGTIDLRNCTTDDANYGAYIRVGEDFTLNMHNCNFISNTNGLYARNTAAGKTFTANIYNGNFVAGIILLATDATATVIVNAYNSNLAAAGISSSGGTKTFNSYGSVVGGVPVASADAITSDNAGVVASVSTEVTEITTDGDSNEDNVTLAAGTDGQIKTFTVVAVGNAADSVKITPASLIGGTQITFAANPLGLGCQMRYSASVSGWNIISNNGGVLA